MKVRPLHLSLSQNPLTDSSFPLLQILETQSATLTNHEVFTHLSTHPRLSPSSSKPNTTATKPSNTTTVIAEVSHYLSSSHSKSQLPSPLSSAQIKQLVRELGKYNLTKAEVLMIVNAAPRELTHLDCVVEELDERLGDAEQEELLAVVGRIVEGEEGRGEEVEMEDV
ncbi:MAG: hypothetical protein L6R40_006722 [Gallowayella cf. fulva]|nr:MAG: hypothetical protein L6R40_006722 [Xanthomendoza cf. fulva]